MQYHSNNDKKKKDLLPTTDEIKKGKIIPWWKLGKSNVSEDDEEDFYSNYDYDFSSPLSGQDRKSQEDKIKNANSLEEVISTAKQGFDPNRRKSAWEEYEETGVWRGYSYIVKPKLDSKYISQMANLLASKYRINVRSGDAWYVDIEKKQLTYDPRTLIYGTKANLIVCLLHEMGHIRHTTPTAKVISEYVKKYPMSAHEVINVYEDLRIDTIMSRSYSSSEEIYEANKPIIKEIAEKYKERARHISVEVVKELKTLGQQCGILDNSGYMVKRLDDDDKLIRQLGQSGFNTVLTNRKNVFGTTDNKECFDKLSKAIKDAEEQDTLFDFLAITILKGYGEQAHGTGEKMKERLVKTEHAYDPVKTMKSTQAVVDLLNSDVYPVIEDLLKQNEEGSKAMQEAIGRALAKRIMDAARNANAQAVRNNSGQDPNDKGKPNARVPMGSGPGKDVIEREWLQGNYEPLRKSVENETKRLIRKLTMIRRQENVIRWNQNERRGRISPKTLHRFANGNPRFFKRKQENPDTVAQFAFSVIVDGSGSMRGERMVQATRGLVVFNEVFKALNVPYEIVRFDDNAKVLKKLEDSSDAAQEKKIAGLANYSGGSTNLDRGLAASKIAQSLKRNKVCIILSDGGVGHRGYLQPYFDEFKHKNVKTVGVSIAAGSEIIDVCGDGVEVNTFSKLPELFGDMIRKVFKQK